MAAGDKKAQRAPKKLRLLWVDDQVEGYSAFVTGLRKNGFVVKTASSAKEAIAVCESSKTPFDLFLVDLKLQHATGLEFVKYHREQSVSGRVCILSSYLHLEAFRGMVKDLNHPVAVLEKNLPSPAHRDFGAFAAKLQGFAIAGEEQDAHVTRRLARRVADRNPFDITFAEYSNLPSDLKDRVFIKAHAMLERHLNELFGQGAVWALFMGSDKKPAAVARSIEDCWPEEEIQERAEDENRIPFQFFPTPEIDDHWGCGAHSQLASYPTVTLAAKSPSGENHSFKAHFDTGSYESYLSFEHWLELTGEPSPGPRAGIVYRGQRLIVHRKRLELKLEDQKTEHRRAIDLNTVLVKNWLRSKFTALCPHICAIAGRSKVKGGHNCRRRMGLIGRNMVIDNNLTLYYDGRTGKTGSNP